MTKKGGKPNKHQKRLAAVRRKKQEDKKKKERFDIMITVVFDQIIEVAVIPVLKQQFGFGPVRLERFNESMTKIEQYSRLTRSAEGVNVDFAKVKKMELKPWAYVKLWEFVIEAARDALGLMGYGKERLEKLYDPHLKDALPWGKLFENIKGG